LCHDVSTFRLLAWSVKSMEGGREEKEYVKSYFQLSLTVLQQLAGPIPLTDETELDDLTVLLLVRVVEVVFLRENRIGTSGFVLLFVLSSY